MKPPIARSSLRPFRVIVCSLAFVLFAALAAAYAGEVENPGEVAGFRGEITGIVKSANADGSGFTITVSKATFNPEASALKDNAPLIGKELALGVRMPKTDGQAHQHPDDLAYIKTLKPGDAIAVKIFSVHSNPRVLRIQAPGHPAGSS